MKKILVATAALALLGATAASAQDQGNNGRWRGNGQGQWQGGQRQGGNSSQYQGGGRQSQGGGQTSQQPDWNAYYRNNPDLQRDYQNNRRNPGYTESQDAYAARHYREHGQSEGRSLPTQSAQRQSEQYNGGQSNNYQGGNRSNDDRSRWNDNNRGRDSGDRQRWNDNDRSRWNDNDRGRNDNRNWNNNSRSGSNWRSDNRFSNYNRNWNASRRYRWGSYSQPRGFYYRRWTFGDVLPSLFWSSSNYWINDYSYFGLPYPPPGCMWVRYGDDALLIDRYSGEIIQVVYGLFY
jgi:Ni/Co efflux regulator RcnB